MYRLIQLKILILLCVISSLELYSSGLLSSSFGSSLSSSNSLLIGGGGDDVSRISGRVVGANEVAEECAYPYQVSLRIGGAHKCGGSLLNRRWLLTAAHCLLKYKLQDFIIVLGSNSLINGGIAFRAQEARLHPDYVPPEHHHDLALVKLEQLVTYSRAIAPVRLPGENLEPEYLVLTSWPSDPDNELASSNDRLGLDYPYLLRVARLPTLALNKCQEIFPSVSQSNLCTLSQVPAQGLCYGDAGSPLVTSDGIQIALGSWGSPCGLGYPDVHVRVYTHVDWIRAMIQLDD